jgi:hypothetical protein
MADPHFVLGSELRSSGIRGGGVLPGGVGAADDHFFRRYRSLLDAEDAAFDELEHAYEDGDRASYESDLAVWHIAIERRTTYLATLGLSADAFTA